MAKTTHSDTDRNISLQQSQSSLIYMEEFFLNFTINLAEFKLILFIHSSAKHLITKSIFQNFDYYMLSITMDIPMASLADAL